MIGLIVSRAASTTRGVTGTIATTVFCVLVCIVGVGCQSRTPIPAPPTASRSVTVGATGLTLGGRTWWPTGFNAYQLATDWSVNEGCGAQVDLDAYFADLPPHALTRFNLFASLAVNKATGRPDMRAVDAVFAAAQRHGQKVLPVLTGGESPCEGDRFKDRDWYASGWRTARTGPHGRYVDWVEQAVRRWHDSPSLAGWEPVGEPEPSTCDPDDCQWPQRACPAGGAEVLRRFFDDVGARIRAIDPDHPIFSGTAGGPQCGLAGDDFAVVGRSPGIDVLDFHDYDENSLVSTGPDGLAQRLRLARRIGKPLVVDEIGIEGGSCLSYADRAQRFRDKLAAQRKAGTAGGLLWAYVPDPRRNDCTFDIGPSDPVWSVLRSVR